MLAGYMPQAGTRNGEGSTAAWVGCRWHGAGDPDTGGQPGNMAKVTIDRMLVATDGSRESIEAARYAAELARELKPRVTLIHVIPSPTIPVTAETLPAGTSSLTPEDEIVIERTLWEGAQAILERSRRPFDEVGLQAEGLIAIGEAAEEIIDIARRERYDLVVVASRGAGGATRAILGSTSDAVVKGAPCPVLVVRRGTRAY